MLSAVRSRSYAALARRNVIRRPPRSFLPINASSSIHPATWTRPLSSDSSSNGGQRSRPLAAEAFDAPVAHESTSKTSSASTPLESTSLQFKPDEPPKPRLSITFTCTVPDCFERSTHEFSKLAYERGIVLVTCPKCKNRHLIADHIGWFKETEGTDGGQLKNIEDLMRAKGEKVIRGRLDDGEVVEYVE